MTQYVRPTDLLRFDTKSSSDKHSTDPDLLFDE